VIERAEHVHSVVRRLRTFPIVGLLGARQIGKTTLGEQVERAYGRPSHRFDLESPPDLARLEDPYLALDELRGLVIIDEVQRRPDLFPVLRVLADRKPRRARFLVLGSASPELLRQSSETLAGRISYYVLPGLSLGEVGSDRLDRLWLRGGFPRSYLSRSHRESGLWRGSFVQTFLERDLPQLGIRISAATLRRFWTMLAHWHGQVWNSSEFARSFGVSDVTVRRYLDLLTSALVVRQLQPWHANVAKRQVKSPKVYLRDSGLLHSLLRIESARDLDSHPKLGASWEGFLIEQVMARLGLSDDSIHFWATHTGAELDLLVQVGRRRIGFEFKRTSSPRTTRSMRSAREDLSLDELNVVHAGKASFPLAKGVRAIAASRLLDDL
jgi:predicted AAA+ superfamily ATPase